MASSSVTYTVGCQYRTECGRHAVVVWRGEDDGLLVAVHYGIDGDDDYELLKYSSSGAHVVNGKKTALSLNEYWYEPVPF